MRRRPHRSGLTLIEVLLAVVIAGIGLVVLITAASRCLAVARAAKIYEDARHLIGRVELQEPIIKEEIEEGVEDGLFDGYEYDGYRWRREIRQLDQFSALAEDDDESHLYEIKTTVFWTERGKQANEEVVTFLYAPEAAEEDGP